MKNKKKIVKKHNILELTDLQKSKLSKEEWGEIVKGIDKNELFIGDGYHICSDGTRVSWRGLPKWIRLKMGHLPEDERDRILEKQKDYRILMGNRTQAAIKASGDKTLSRNKDWELCMSRKDELMDLFGKMYSSVEVHKIITSDWGLHEISTHWMLKFQRDNIDDITRLRDNYKKDVSSVRLVHKRSRLDELTYLYQSRKIKYEATEGKEDYKLLLVTMEQIRKEVEGDKLTINGQIKVEHEHIIQDHVNNEILKYLNINDIIIGRLCARMKINPKLLIYRLHSSYYKKFTGFVPEEMDDGNDIIYPSQTVYDFTRMKDMSKQVDIQDAEIVEDIPIKPSKVDVKALLSKKLKEKKESLKGQKGRIDNTDSK